MYKVGIITTSDKGARGEREDKSARVIREIVESEGWEVVNYQVIPDDFSIIKETLIQFSDQEKLNLVFTTGGTGMAPRDNTPEATKTIIEREVPGLPEVMRAESLKITPRAMLSRAVSGIRHQTLIINLPGSPKGVQECLEVIMQALPHGMELLLGRGGDCAR
ncbi:MAG: molybdopterin adenylyltransferase [Clostridiales bacterium]|nr:molybdopterin adenylyltransferase [Clostridiales bacterium]MCF8022059.1 molybdopterin adenylyltransferase [Clostridiales bacterium]